MDEALRLDHQLCFPLYACARRVVGRYTPLLKPLNLTYTQYIVELQVRALPGVAAPSASQPRPSASSLLGMDSEPVCP